MFTSRQPRPLKLRDVSGGKGRPASSTPKVIGSWIGAAGDDDLASPVSMLREAIMAASRLEPQSRLTVVAGTLTGSPASRLAIRPRFRFSSPAPFALPKITSSTAAPSSLGLRSSRAVITYEARSSGRTPASAPLSRPNGVRTASYR